MITDAAGTDNAQCKHLGQAMCDAFDAYSNKSNLIRDEQMHLTASLDTKLFGLPFQACYGLTLVSISTISPKLGNLLVTY